MRVVQTLAEVCAALEARPAGVVGIDGVGYAGKSWLADRLGAALGRKVIHLDDFLASRTGGYVESIDFDRLRRALATQPDSIVEGVCLLEVFGKIGGGAPFLVYVTRAVPSASPESLFSKSLAPVDGAGRGARLRREVSEYHHGYRPNEIADIIFMNTQTPGHSRSGGSALNYEIDAVYIRSRTQLSMAFAGGGALTMVCGLVLILLGKNGSEEAIFKLAGFELSGKGMGAVMMTSSVAWVVMAFCVRPVYAKIHTLQERTNVNTGAIERWENVASTASVPPSRNTEGDR